MDSNKGDNKQVLSNLSEMTFERLQTDTRASWLRIICRIMSLLLIIVASVVSYSYFTKIPNGITNEQQIMDLLAVPIDDSLGPDIEFNKYSVIDEINENRVILYKNAKTNRFVFPVRDKNTGKTHYCYLASYESPNGFTTKFVTDIDHANWSRMINKKVASIEGDNPVKIYRKYTIAEYYNAYSSLYYKWLNDYIN